MTRQCRLLIIEDNPVDAMLLQRQVTQLSSWTASWARDLTEAVAMLQDEPRPDAFAIDLTLPDCEGLAALRHCLALAGDAPVLVVTAEDQLDSALASLRMGAIDYLVKGESTSRGIIRALQKAMLIDERIREAREASRKGLLLRLDGSITPTDRLAVDAIIAAYRATKSASDIDLAEYRKLNDGCLIRLEATDPADLEAVAETLQARPWEQTTHDDQVANQLARLLRAPALRQLTLLLDRGRSLELWVATEDGPELARSWDMPADREAALARLLTGVMQDADVPGWFRAQGFRSIADEVPTRAGVRDQVAAAIAQLMREGRVDGELFDALERGFPTSAPVVRAHRGRW